MRKLAMSHNQSIHEGTILLVYCLPVTAERTEAEERAMKLGPREEGRELGRRSGWGLKLFSSSLGLTVLNV